MVNIRKVAVRGRKLPNVLNKKQLIKLFEAIEDLPVLVGSLLSLFCGLRVSEICNLKKTDIDLEECKIKVVQGKGSKDRVVMLPQVMKPFMEMWFRLNKESEYFLHAFHNNDEPLPSRYMQKKFTEALKETGLRIERIKTVTGQQRYMYSFHTLRHTYATYLLEKGVDLYYVQRALGHSDIHTTQIYAYISQKDLQEKINTVFAKRSIVKKQAHSTVDPYQVLQLRLAHGEISQDEFQNMLNVLKQSQQVEW